MPAPERGSFDEADDVPPRSLWERFADLVRKPDDDRPSLGQRLTGAMIKADSGAAPKPEPTTVEELEEAVKRADDKERLIGLIAAPLAALIGLLITSSLATNATKGTSHTAYSVLGIVLLALALGMLAMAWWRKRLYLGIVMALYGISVFNLRFWGFGVPYVLVGAWYLVRRAQSKLTAPSRSPISSGPGAAACGRSPVRFRPGPSPIASRSATLSSSRVGNTGVTVRKSPGCIVCGGRAHLPVSAHLPTPRSNGPDVAEGDARGN
jgi:hypothetical protein